MFPFRRDSEHWGMVARASGGTKGTALAWVSGHYGVDISETVCVGDWHQRPADDDVRWALLRDGPGPG